MSIKGKFQKKTNILVVGDIILDQYLWTNVNRISPEAPVPVCLIKDKTHCLGGAGNVANNLSAFGVNVSMAGIIGKDQSAKIILDCFKTANINSEHCIQSENYNTICKSRVMAKGQQLCRLDEEDVSQDIQEDIQQCLASISKNQFDYDAIVLSDYNKGIVSDYMAKEIIKMANKNKVPIVVDPKSNHIQKYAGATFLTPNLSKFQGMVGNIDLDNLDFLVNTGQTLISENNIQFMIVTRSEKGMSVISQNNHQHYATKAIEVSDVTGAGDTVVAALALGLSLNLRAKDIIHFANLAAGVVVSKVGTATATIQEILDHEQHF